MILYEDHGFRYILKKVDVKNGIVDAINFEDNQSPIYVDYHKIEAVRLQVK